MFLHVILVLTFFFFSALTLFYYTQKADLRVKMCVMQAVMLLKLDRMSDNLKLVMTGLMYACEWLASASLFVFFLRLPPSSLHPPFVFLVHSSSSVLHAPYSLVLPSIY